MAVAGDWTGVSPQGRPSMPTGRASGTAMDRTRANSTTAFTRSTTATGLPTLTPRIRSTTGAGGTDQPRVGPQGAGGRAVPAPTPSKTRG